MQSSGKIIIEPESNVWPHELKTAEALAAAGYTVRFLRRNERRYARSADCLINDIEWEMKAPQIKQANRVQKVLRKALHQARAIIFDSERIGLVPDPIIERELRKWARELQSMKYLIFIDKNRNVIVIK